MALSKHEVTGFPKSNGLGSEPAARSPWPGRKLAQKAAWKDWKPGSCKENIIYYYYYYIYYYYYYHSSYYDY